jgi:hypothetical protein
MPAIIWCCWCGNFQAFVAAVRAATAGVRVGVCGGRPPLGVNSCIKQESRTAQYTTGHSNVIPAANFVTVQLTPLRDAISALKVLTYTCTLHPFALIWRLSGAI